MTDAPSTTTPDATPWRRVWCDGLSQLVIEVDPSGRIRFAIDGIDGSAGPAISLSRTASTAVAAFIREESR